jgi:hypothetical protein
MAIQSNKSRMLRTLHNIYINKRLETKHPQHTLPAEYVPVDLSDKPLFVQTGVSKLSSAKTPHCILSDWLT